MFKTVIDTDNWFQKLVGHIKCFFGFHTIVGNGVPVAYACCKYCNKSFKFEINGNITK